MLQGMHNLFHIRQHHIDHWQLASRIKLACVDADLCSLNVLALPPPPPPPQVELVPGCKVPARVGLVPLKQLYVLHEEIAPVVVSLPVSSLLFSHFSIFFVVVIVTMDTDNRGYRGG